MKTSSVSTNALNLLLVIFLIAGCASKSSKIDEPEPTPEQTATVEEQEDKEADNANKIQGINGFSGKINGTPVSGSKFETLQIGMTVNDVIAIAGKATWRGTYGRPFDFSGDRTAFILRYRKKGNLIFTGGKLFDSSKGNLIIINHDEKEHGMRYLLW